MFTKSIRWRMQLWLAFLLIGILSGFGLTAYQLHRTNRFSDVDKELERRVAALNSDVHGLPPFGPSKGGRFPFPNDWDMPPQKSRGPDMWDFGPPDMGEPHGPERREPWGPDKRDAKGPGMREPRSRREGLFEGREIRLSTKTMGLFEQQDTNSFYYALWSRGGNFMKSSTNTPSTVTYPGRAAVTNAPNATRMRANYREAIHFTEIGECILVGRNMTADLNAMRRFAWWLVTAGGTVLLFGLGGGWVLVTHALRPIENISSTASQISAGNLSERINVADTDSELGRLAGILNSTFARLEAAFRQQKQFTADASHELRTPIAVIIAEAQTTLARERNALEYRETVETCLEAAQQMKRLSQSLLELARYDAGQEPIEHQRLDLAARTKLCIEMVQPLAEERSIKIHHNLAKTKLHGDATRLDQVITNLLTNAIHYNKPQGEIQVSTSLNADLAVLTVTDTGQGICADDLPHLFKRFFRADKSRSNASGRSGLGLAISKAIVDAHGGSIEVSSQVGAGTTFIVKLPV